ncbi:hypothetical protein [Cupriavidus necator]
MSAQMSALESLIHDVAIAAKAQFKAQHSSYQAGRAVIVHLLRNVPAADVVKATAKAIDAMREQVADPKVWQATVSKNASAYRRIAEAFALGLITADKASITGKTEAENLKEAIATAKAPAAPAGTESTGADTQGETQGADTKAPAAPALPSAEALQALAMMVATGHKFDADMTNAIMALANAVTLRAEAETEGRQIGADVADTLAA